jgi:hypothetical protein
MRRFIALLLLCVTATFQVESVFGEVRDAEVHHERVAEAWVHAHDRHATHSHVEIDESRGESRDVGTRGVEAEEREQGSATDHCTHVHGVALIPPLELSFVASESCFERDVSITLPDLQLSAQTPPPRSTA